MKSNPAVSLDYQLYRLALSLLVITFFWGASFFFAGCAAKPNERVLKKSINPPENIDSSQSELIETEWGTRIEGIRLSAAGYMLDFRYHILDPIKAMPLFERKTKPYLIDQASGAKFAVPSPAKTGPLRNSNKPLADRTYFMFFANPSQFVKAGSKVTVVIGDFRVENIIVE